MKVKNVEELKNILASELRAYSYEVGTGRGLEPYLSLLEDQPATVYFTLDDNGGLVASATLPPPEPEPTIEAITPYFEVGDIDEIPESVEEEKPKSSPKRRKSS